MVDLKKELLESLRQYCLEGPQGRGQIVKDADEQMVEGSPNNEDAILHFQCYTTRDHQNITVAETTQTFGTYHLVEGHYIWSSPEKARVCNPLFQASYCPPIQPKQPQTELMNTIAERIFAETYDGSQLDSELFASMMFNRIKHDGFPKELTEVIAKSGWKTRQSIKPSPTTHPAQWNRAVEIAEKMMTGIGFKNNFGPIVFIGNLRRYILI